MCFFHVREFSWKRTDIKLRHLEICGKDSELQYTCVFFSNMISVISHHGIVILGKILAEIHFYEKYSLIFPISKLTFCNVGLSIHFYLPPTWYVIIPKESSLSVLIMWLFSLEMPTNDSKTFRWNTSRNI